MNRRYRLTFTSPSGEIFDASTALDLGELGTISISPESDLSILTHGDMSMDLDNSDGAIEAFLQHATITDIYDVVLERERIGGVSGWDRIFRGVLDLPYSLRYDDKAKTVHVIAYSHTKALERVPADGTAEVPTNVKRALAFKTAAITEDTSQLVFFGTEASDLEIGDVVELNDGGSKERFTVARKIDNANVVTTAPARRTFSETFAMVVTPFFHDIPPKALLEAIADEANVVFDDHDLGSPLADFPIATPLSIAELNLGGVPQSIVASNGGIVATFDDASVAGTKRKTLASPIAIWADGDTSNTAQLDWTPYTDSEPGAILVLTGTGSGAADTGQFTPDYIHGGIWHITVNGLGVLQLRKNGVVQADVSPAIPAIVTEGGWWSQEYDPAHDGFLLSYNDNDGTRAIKYFVVFGSTVVDVDLTRSGRIRAVRYDTGVIHVLVDDTTGAIEFWDTLTLAMRHRIERPSQDFIQVQTMRTWGNAGTIDGIASKRWFTFLFERQGETWLAIYDARGAYTNWQFVSEYRISAGVSDRKNRDGIGFLANFQRGRCYQTIFDPGGLNPLAVVFAGGEWAVLSTAYDGVIRYANFDRSSCAKAARDVATAINSIVAFDYFGTMTVVNRKSLGSGDVIADLGVPLTQIRSPISELYRSSVSVKGTDSSGEDIEEIQGDEGDSARRLTIDSDLITTPGMALACAITTLQFVSQIREQREVDIDDDGTVLLAYNRVTMAGKTWVVYKLETDLEQEQHHLTLLEVQ